MDTRRNWWYPMVKVYVEGGGESNALKTACREGFSKFFEKAGLRGKMPRIVACGSRQDAYADFCIAIKNGEDAFLLIDSEAVIDAEYQKGKPEEWKPWGHLAQREGDKWEKPPNSKDLQCHFMVLCMESWFLADRAALKQFFGQGFKENALPNAMNSIESIDKKQLYESLARASSDCKTKARYGKGEHSFKILAIIDPHKVISASSWAKRLITTLEDI